MQGIEPQSMGCELRVLITMLQVLMCSRLNFDNKIFSNKIGKKNLAPPESPDSDIFRPLLTVNNLSIKQAATHYSTG